MRFQPDVLEWLLAGDPPSGGKPCAIYRMHRSQPGEPSKSGSQRREGAPRLLAHRDQGGRWTPRLYGKKWLSTTYSLLLLRELGLPRADPRARASCALFSKRDWVAMAASISPPAAR
jgi:hypothetical protein